MLLSVLVLPACQPPPESEDLVARVGGAVLLESELEAALGGFFGTLDTADARSQIIEQWVENELLYQEALRLNLASQAAVEAQLKEAERAVLIGALVARLYADSDLAITDMDLQEYYESHKERLLTLEPYLLVQFVETTSADHAQEIYRRIRRAPPEDVAALFDSLAGEYATEPELSLSLAANYWPENRLFVSRAAVREVLLERSPPPAGRVFAVDSLHYFLRVLDRVAPGTVPEFSWIREKIRVQYAIDRRKQLYERQVQRLRTEALAREVLEVAN